MQMVLKRARGRSAAPASAPRVSTRGSENSGTGSRRGKGGGFAVNTSKKLGLSSGGGGRRERRRRRESESLSEEEVLPKKKPRSKMVAVEDDEEEMESEKEEEEERIKLGKIGKKSGEKVAKTGTYRNAESDEEVEKGNAVKSGKTAGKYDSLIEKKTVERDEESDEEEESANFGRSDKWGGKNVSLMKKKEVARKDDSEEDVGSFLKRAKRSSKMLLNDKRKKVLKDDSSDDQEEGVDILNKRSGKKELGRKKKKAEVDDLSEEEEEKLSEELVNSRGGVELGNQKKKVVQNDQSEDEEEERHKIVVGSVRMKGKIDVRKKENTDGSEMSDEEERNKEGKSGKRYSELEFKWKEKKVESSEETEEEEVERGRELTRAQNSGGLKWGNNKRKTLRNNQCVIEGGKHRVFRGRNKSRQFKQRQKKKIGWRATSDEEEEGKANAERVDNKGGRLDLGRKEKLERDDVGTDDEELRSEVKSDESADEVVIDLKRQKIQGNSNESNKRDGVAKSVEKGDAARLGKTKKTLLKTEAGDEEEEGIANLEGNNRAELVKTSKIKGLRTKTLQMGIKSILDEQGNYGNGGTNDTVKDGNIDDAKKKSHFGGKSEDVERGKANRDSEDGGEESSKLTEKSNEVRKEIKEEYDGDYGDDSEKMHDDCLLRSAEKDLKPEAFSKIEDKKLREEKGGLLKMLKVEKEEKASQEGTVDGENVDPLLRAAKKAKETVKVGSPSEERRKGLKIKDIGESKEEEVDNTDDCNIGVHSVGERSSRKKISRPKADLRRRHFSTDVSFLPCLLNVCTYANFNLLGMSDTFILGN